MVEEQQKGNILEKKITEAINSLGSGHRDAVNTLNSLKNTYGELSDYLTQASWVQRGETIQVEATYITSIAGVAVFLGAVQISFIAYAASIFPTSKASLNVQQTVNIFSFCALLFDVLGALFALITSGTLLLRASEAKKFTTTKQKLFDDIVQALPTSFTDPHEAHPIFNLLDQNSRDNHKRAQRLAHLIDEHSQSCYDVLLVIIAGVAFFFGSFFLFIVSTQPLQVWLSTIMISGITTAMLLYMQKRRHPIRDYIIYWESIFGTKDNKMGV